MPLKQQKSKTQRDSVPTGVKDREVANPKEAVHKLEAHMEESLMEVNMKLNAIMSYLGIKNPCPSKGDSQHPASASAQEKFFVFRNDVYDNEANGLLIGSQSFSDDAHFSPRSHFSDASLGLAEVPETSQDNHHPQPSKMKHISPTCRLHAVDRGSFGSETATDYSDSLGSNSCTTTPKSLNENENKGLTTELPCTRRAQSGDYNKAGRGALGTVPQAINSGASRVSGSNNGELSWRDIVPIIGGSDHEAEVIGKDHKSGIPQGHKDVVKATAKSKARASPPCSIRKSSSVQSLKSTGRGAQGTRSMSRRELLRTDTAQEQGMTDEVAAVTKNDISTNREVVIQIQQKIMELRRMESLDKRPQEPVPAPRSRQKEDPPWISEAWDMLCENRDDINSIGELEDAFCAPPQLTNDM